MRGNFFVMFYHPDRWWVIPFLLFPLPLLFLLGMIARSDLSASYNFLFALELTGGWVGFWLIIFLLALAYIRQTLEKRNTLTISAAGFRCNDWTPQYLSKWTDCKGVLCIATDILIFQKSAGAGIAVPLNAFADPREGQRFYETAVGYWQNAKTGQPFTPADATEVWPPAPRPANSAEPSDSLEG